MGENASMPQDDEAEASRVLPAIPLEVRQRKAYVSFGDDGVTASANAYGNLMQMTRYLGERSGDQSGFLCAELSAEPFFSPSNPAERLEILASTTADPNSGSHLRIEYSPHNPSFLKLQQVSFVEHRWPCFHYDSEFPLSVQYVVNRGIVYQIYTLTVKKNKDAGPPKVSLLASTQIRNLDFTKDYDLPSDDESDSGVEGEDYQRPIATNEEPTDENSVSDGVNIAMIYENEWDENEDEKGNSMTYGNLEDCWTYRSLDRCWVYRKLVMMKHKYVCSCISLFLDGQRQPEHARIQGQRLDVIVDTDAWANASDNEDVKLEVTVAYTLDVEDGSPSLISRVPPEQVAEAKEKVKMNTRILKLSDDPHLNLILWRNVEHILSVCSIPIRDYGLSKNPLSTAAGKASTTASDHICPVALTCGDIAAHRIATKASFHAFQFLILAMKYIHTEFSKQHIHLCDLEKACGQHPYGHGNCNIYWRIWRVCWGHVKWLQVNWATNYEGCGEYVPEEFPLKSASQRWVSGHARNKIEPGPTLDPRIDTAFQIIKMASFAEASLQKADLESHFTKNNINECGDPDRLCSEFREVADHLGTIVHLWTNELDEAKKADKHVYPRATDTGPDRFHLVDHALIWWAIKSAEQLGLSAKLVFNHEKKMKKRLKISESIQYSIIKRFTAENPVSKLRMLAATRSHLDTRFLLRAEETILFHAAEHGFFAKAEMQGNIDVWTNTENCQQDHEDNEDPQWTDPIQFGMAMILTSQNKQISSLAPAKKYQHAKSILFGSSSPSGLIAGMLNSFQMPAFFEENHMQDDYWSATFEAPYILWKFPHPGGENPDIEHVDISSSPPPLFQSSRQHRPNLEDFTTATVAEQLSQICKHLKGSLPEGQEGRETISMEEYMPFGGSINQSNIVLLKDDWLYKEPKFFLYGGEDIGTRLDRVANDLDGVANSFDRLAATVISRAKLSSTADFWNRQIKAIITDIPRTSKTSLGSQNAQIKPRVARTNGKLLMDLDHKRTQANAKKRLLQFFKMTDTTALICFVVSSMEEGLAGFFDHHASYRNYMFDNATPGSVNEWVTELHLSFYQVLGENDEKDETLGDLPMAEEVLFPSPSEGQGEHKWIRRAVISFRFDGDFFDRYWTCHFLEHVLYNSPKIDKDRSRREFEKLDITLGKLRENPWKQRRVLELMLFDRILERIIDSTDGILQEAKNRVRQSLSGNSHERDSRRDVSNEPTQGHARSALEDALDLLGVRNNDAFLSASTLCHKILYLLQAVEDDLDRNLETIQNWCDREKERGLNRPRWTWKDEGRYRRTISKWQVSNNHRILELRQLRARVDSYRSSLVKKLEDSRNELDLRGADDIQRFTYITAVFLPLGFATGVFSMSEAPTRTTLISMVLTAIVALASTIIVLNGFKLVQSQIARPVQNQLGRYARFAHRAVSSWADAWALMWTWMFIFIVGGAFKLVVGRFRKRTSPSSPRSSQQDTPGEQKV